MEEIDPRHLLIKVAEILERLDIPYAITGGMAVLSGRGPALPQTLILWYY